MHPKALPHGLQKYLLRSRKWKWKKWSNLVSRWMLLCSKRLNNYTNGGLFCNCWSGIFYNDCTILSKFVFAGMLFFSYMVEDQQTPTGPSYVDFLVHVHRQIQIKMSSWICMFFHVGFTSFDQHPARTHIEFKRRNRLILDIHTIRDRPINFLHLKYAEQKFCC